ncbi:MAG: STAS/SEC14 domain-containing protein [Caldilineaceae bacterium]|nr:STAS/SEC14 domain-containing protein [Caldilineaceae bacterium]
MIQTIPTGSDKALAFSLTGKVTDDDYEDVLIPAVEAAVARHDKLCLLYQLGPEFDDYEAEAMWDDAKVGMKHLTDFEKIAFVTDHKWMARTVKAFGFLMPGEVKLYSNDEFDAAMTWIVSE